MIKMYLTNMHDNGPVIIIEDDIHDQDILRESCIASSKSEIAGTYNILRNKNINDYLFLSQSDSVVMSSIISENILSEAHYQKAYHSATEILQLLPEGLRYHSLQHTQSVVAVADSIGKEEGLPDQEQLCLLTAALFHDIGFVSTGKPCTINL